MRRAAQALVLAILAAFGVLIGTRLLDAEHWPLIELTRYLPYYWLLLPCALALILGAALGWRWWAPGVAPLALLLGPIMEPSFGAVSRAPPPAGAPTLRLMTYNVKAIAGLGGGRLESIAAEVRRADPDLLVLQDADGLRTARDTPPNVDGPPLFGLPRVYALGQYVVATRLPLLGCEPGQIGYRDESHRYLRCRIGLGGREVTIVTAHFRSPRDGLSATRARARDWSAAWEQNFADRLGQARALAADVGAIGGPLVVAGDLNAPGSSPVVQALLRTGLRDAHASAGFGYGYTYGQSLRAGRSFLRIDHVLVGGGVRARRVEVGGGEASEHRPLIVELDLAATAVPTRESDG